MNKFILISTLLLSLTVSAEIFKPEQRKFLEATPYLVSKDHQTIPGKVILTWNCQGKFHHSTTQAIFKLEGKENMSPLKRAYVRATNNFEIVKNRFEELQQRNIEANKNLDEISERYPLLKSLVEKIRERIATKVERVEDLIEAADARRKEREAGN